MPTFIDTEARTLNVHSDCVEAEPIGRSVPRQPLLASAVLVVVWLVAVIAWPAVGAWLVWDGNRQKAEALLALRGKRATIRYSPGPGRMVFKFTGLVGTVERGRLHISNGVEDRHLHLSLIRDIEADGFRLRRR